MLHGCSASVYVLGAVKQACDSGKQAYLEWHQGVGLEQHREGGQLVEAWRLQGVPERLLPGLAWASWEACSSLAAPAEAGTCAGACQGACSLEAACQVAACLAEGMHTACRFHTRSKDRISMRYAQLSAGYDSVKCVQK